MRARVLDDLAGLALRKLGRTTKPSAMADANPTRGSSRLSSKQRKRGAQSGWYFTFERYSASSCHQREKRRRGPSARCGGSGRRRCANLPRNTERNTAKLSETRTTPISSERVANSETINSTTPLGAVAYGASGRAKHRSVPPRHEREHADDAFVLGAFTHDGFDEEAIAVEVIAQSAERHGEAAARCRCRASRRRG